jgi:DNA-directed RNA polymerase specialized sigma24 family protein
MDGEALARVREAVAGDAAALAQLLDELAPLVVRTTRLIVGSATTQAEDAAQEALVDLARGITRLRDPDDELRAALGRAFDRLPPRRRATAVLRLYLGLSERETADVFGTSVGAVKSQLYEARRELARSLRDAGVAPSTSPVTKGAP